ncbi:hypothetical protein MYMAC_000780 [Corallococcus macrosporus DSM 14697]|uniref:Uncharacterized protein n=1 Tax=Corallococcus macrosporus DSM 14697 TaxID=1189310 RepID=A0A250JQ12_9BACT|nr:hypothetical protein MYMAC_000780 [Corallococcus macrosporus DSM 14697]
MCNGAVMGDHFSGQHVTHFLAGAVEVSGALVLVHPVKRVHHAAGPLADATRAFAEEFQCARARHEGRCRIGLAEAHFESRSHQEVSHLGGERQGFSIAQHSSCQSANRVPIEVVSHALLSHGIALVAGPFVLTLAELEAGVAWALPTFLFAVAIRTNACSLPFWEVRVVRVVPRDGRGIRRGLGTCHEHGSLGRGKATCFGHAGKPLEATRHGVGAGCKCVGRAPFHGGPRATGATQCQACERTQQGSGYMPVCHCGLLSAVPPEAG